MKTIIKITSDEIDEMVDDALISPEDYKGDNPESLNEQRGAFREGVIHCLKKLKREFEEAELPIILEHPKR